MRYFLLTMSLLTATSQFGVMLFFGCEGNEEPPGPQTSEGPSPVPPFRWGSVWISPDIIVASDPSSLTRIEISGRGERTVYDRRSDKFNSLNVYLFVVHYGIHPDGHALQEVEYRVNPEFGSREAAQAQVERYAPVLGQLPAVLRAPIKHVVIHVGNEGWGGVRNGIVIHADFGEPHISNGFTEEVYFHEAANAVLDASHSSTPGWLKAQEADGKFISPYARAHPDREDVAESFLPYFAVRCRPDRLSDADRAAILEAIPNRMTYFDEQGFDMTPCELLQ